MAARVSSGRRWVALIRAINGSPTNRIRMVDLRELLVEAGCSDVTWHIQTGNMYLTADGQRHEVASAIADRLHRHGMRNAWPVLWTPDELRALVADAPFAGFDPAAFILEVTFLYNPPQQPDTSFLIERGGVIARLDDRVLCLAIPREPDASRPVVWTGGANGWIEKRWAVWSTTRAWNVVEQIAAKEE
jgi:uncharacterized protein (DUF1697 family)